MEKLKDSKNHLAELYGLEKITAENLEINIGKKGSVVYKIKNKDGDWKEYRDPDTESKTLYEDWKEYLKKKLPEGTFVSRKNNGSFEIVAEINNKKFVLSSDYIGPSKKWAAKAFRANDKNMCEEMAKILNVCRRFGGHMIWPKNQYITIPDRDDPKKRNSINITYGGYGRNSINMSRGGSAGVYDRFDVTLYSLKKYFDLFIKKDKKECLDKGLYDKATAFIASCKDKIDIEKNGFRLLNLFLSFELTSEWFEVFADFNKFIQVFELQDFIENGEPVVWGSKDKITELCDSDNNYENYTEYIDGCTNAIKNRANCVKRYI